MPDSYIIFVLIKAIIGLLLEGEIFLVLEDDLVILFLLLLHHQIDIEVFVFYLFGEDFHLGVAFRSFLQVLGDFPGDLLLERRYGVGILQKFGFGLAELRINVFVLPHESSHQFLKFTVLIPVLLGEDTIPLLLLVVLDVLHDHLLTLKFMSLLIIICTSSILLISSCCRPLSRSAV